jgi:5-hydroxyisourate hydrolase
MISTHVLDTAQGAPAARLPVELDVFISGQGWREAGHAVTDEHGRIERFGEAVAPGVYRLVFDVAAYMPQCFFPSIAVTFEIHNASDEHYHVPLLLSPFGYTTYRGS